MNKPSLIEKFFNQKNNPKFNIKKINEEHSHAWGRWCIFKHELVDGDSEWENGSYYWQKRECKECGFSQFS